MKNTNRLELIIYWFAVVTSLVHLSLNYIAFLPENWAAAIHFGLYGCLGTLIYVKNRYWQPIFIILLVACVVYLISFEDALYDRGQYFISTDYIFSTLTIFLALYLTYKVVGWFIPCLIVLSLTYIAFWGHYVPGVFNFRGLSLESVLFRSYFSPDGMFGAIAQISWTFVFMFVLFGAFLQISGAGEYLIHQSARIASRVRGGPGLVAVLASGAMGSVSGSAIANTAATGVITIPAMKKYGFSAEFSAGVEAAASTGGQLMPPIMGAGAFIMASYTQLPYLSIISAALFPAILYYLCVGFFVRSYAIKYNLSHTRESTDLPTVHEFRNGWRHLAAIVVLVACLIGGFTPLFSVAMAIISIICFSWLSESPMKLSDISNALSLGSKSMAVTSILLVTIGLLVNAITTSGVGNTFSLMVVEWSGNSLILLLLLIAIASLILGAGLPVTASYIIVATLVAPVLSDFISIQLLHNAIASGASLPDMMLALFPDLSNPDLSVKETVLALAPDARALIYKSILSPEILMMSLLSSHLIIFWLSQDSNVTPPVCLVAYTAAGIADASHSKTAFCAWKIAKGLYLVPVLMAFTDLVMGSFTERLVVFIFSAVGIFHIICAWEGIVTTKINHYQRMVCAVIGVMLLWPLEAWMMGKVVLCIPLLVYLIWGRFKHYVFK